MPRAKCQNTVVIFIVGSGRLHREDRIPLVKAHVDRDRDRHEAFERRHFLYGRSHMSGQQICVLLGFRIVAIHRRAHGDEMQVVAVIHHRVDALHSAGLDVSAVDRRGLLRWS